MSEIADLDGRHVLHPHQVVGRPKPPVVFVEGSGARVRDEQGKWYIDGTCGLWVCAVGHGRASWPRRRARRWRRSSTTRRSGSSPTCRRSAWPPGWRELAAGGLDRVFFTNGGSEGNETAIKLARLAWHAQGQPERTSS